MNTTINRFGKCPNCGTNWDGGDILEVISRKDIFMHKKHEDMLQIVEDSYGYTLEDKKRFTNLIRIEDDELDILQCSGCGAVWKDDVMYMSRFDLNMDRPALAEANHEGRTIEDFDKGDIQDFLNEAEGLDDDDPEENWKKELDDLIDDDDPPF